MIPDDVIEKYMGVLFGRSEPGQKLHHLLLASADGTNLDALGLPRTDDLRMSMYGIDYVDTGLPRGAERFIADTIRGAVVEQRQGLRVPCFAGLAAEIHDVTLDNDENEVMDNLARRMQADGKLQEHPAVVEVTLLYAACRDGRRWTGKHLLTGDKAGTIVGPTLLTGDLKPEEYGLHNWLIRSAVGLA